MSNLYDPILDMMSPMGELLIKNNEATALTNYQVKLTITKSPTKHSGSTLNVGGRIQSSNYNDIAFVGQDNKILAHQVIIHADKSNITSPELWIKIPYIAPSGYYRIKMYGGHPTANRNNGDGCFELWDHFEGNTLNTTKWSGTGATVSNSAMLQTGGSGTWTLTSSSVSMPINYIVEGLINPISDSSAWVFGCMNGSSGIGVVTNTVNNKYYITNNAGTATNTSRTSTITTYTKLGIYRIGSSVAFYENDILKNTNTTNIPTMSMYIDFQKYGTSSILYVDWILVRKYTANEPTITSR